MQRCVCGVLRADGVDPERLAAGEHYVWRERGQEAIQAGHPRLRPTARHHHTARWRPDRDWREGQCSLIFKYFIIFLSERANCDIQFNKAMAYKEA